MSLKTHLVPQMSSVILPCTIPSATETESVSIWASIIQKVSEPLPIKLSLPVIYLQLPCLRISQSILVCVQFPGHGVPAAHLGAASLRFVHALQGAEQQLSIWIRLVPGSTKACKALSEQITWKRTLDICSRQRGTFVMCSRKRQLFLFDVMKVTVLIQK